MNLTGVGNLFQKLMDKFILGAHFVLKDKTGVRSMCEYRHFPSKAKSIKVKTRRLAGEKTGDTTSPQEELSSLPEKFVNGMYIKLRA
jgi:hypothetical protein